MSDAKPFADYDEDAGLVRISGIDVSNGAKRYDCERINAAVSRERREAAAEALEAFANSHALAEAPGRPMTAFKSAVRYDLRTRAAALRKGDG